MTIEIVAIGDEVLRGFTVNSNAAYIGQKLFEAGFVVNRHTVITDEEKSLYNGLDEALKRSSIVICTGGLGPTFDDRTRMITAKLFDSGFSFNEQVAADLKTRYGDLVFSIKDQATLPNKASFLLNEVGTAPGLIFSSDKGTLVLLPGVPEEMKVMFDNKLLPYLEKEFSVAKKHFVETINLFNTSEIDVDEFIRKEKDKYKNVSVGIYPTVGIFVSVRLVSRDEKQLEIFSNAVKEKFKAQNINASSIVEALHSWFISEGKTLGLAESCTGGKVAARLISLSGASRFFKGSIVAYDNDIKKRVLGVSKNTLEANGAVNEETVKEMAEGTLNVLKVDYALAISGIAGPTGGSKEKPVGTVCFAISSKDNPTQTFTFKAFGDGDRAAIIDYTTNFVLGSLWEIIMKDGT